jgi:hypothetical protein
VSAENVQYVQKKNTNLRPHSHKHSKIFGKQEWEGGGEGAEGFPYDINNIFFTYIFIYSPLYISSRNRTISSAVAR